MTHSIYWHQECLKNAMATVERLKQDRDRMDRVIKECETSNGFLQYQISEAIKAHKFVFDRERWRVTKPKKKGGE